jgi:hypothetical protein
LQKIEASTFLVTILSLFCKIILDWVPQDFFWEIGFHGFPEFSLFTATGASFLEIIIFALEK